MGTTPGDPNPQHSLSMAADGDPQAWREIVDAFSPRVYALLLRQCGDRELAEELTQQTFVKLVSQLARRRYEEQGKFESWLFRIATNGLRDEIRRRRRQARPMDFTAGDGNDGRDRIAEPVSPDAQNPFEGASRAEQIELLRRAVAQLSEVDQQILNLRHTAGLSYVQIAEVLDEPLGTVLARGHRALGKLRRKMTSQTAPPTPDSEV